MKYWVIKTVGLLLLNTTAIAQIHCAEAAAKQLPWRLRPETSRGDWAQYMRPVITEMQRLFPQPLPGLELTYGLYGTKGPFINRPGAREYYEAFFMIKDIVCERQNDGSRKVIPEGETGCWIYYRANDIGQLLHTHLGGTGYTLPGTDWPLYMGDLRVSENENGLASIYTYGDKDEYQFAGWYIGPRKQLPVRAITKKEWALAYRHYWLTKWAADNKRLEGVLLSSKAGYQRTLDDNTLAADQKQQLLKSYTTGDADTRSIIARNRQQAIECRQLTEEMLLAPDANEPAKVSAVNGLLFEPARMRRTEGKLYHIYVQDMTVFNGTLPAAQPQYIIAYLRRQDITPAKTAFIKRVEEAFDWNVVRRMTGVSPLAQPITISGMGNSPGGYTSGPLPEGPAPTAPTLSVGSSVAGAYFSEDFAATTVGQPPAQWTVSNGSAIVQEINGSKCLTLKEPGLFFPGYAILQLPQNFTLSFDLGWNKDISYYSPDFMVHIGAARYDNTLKRYDRKQVDANAYTSAAMERTCLWIDPHWNDIGYCGWEVFDKNGGYLRKESFRTPQFYRERNTVAVKLVRQGSQLKVYFNDELIKEVADMQPNIRWNFFGFGLSNAPNAAPTDEFYLRNIRLSQ